MVSIDTTIWNFGIRMAVFVLFSFVVVLVVGVVARLFFFEDARKLSPGVQAGPDSSPSPEAPKSREPA